MSKANRCSKVQFIARLNIISNMIAQNHTSGDIVKYCKENYSVTEKTARLYIAHARAEAMEFLTKQKDEIMSDFLLQYRALYQAALTKGDLNTAFKVLEKMQSLFGVECFRNISAEIDGDIYKIRNEIIPLR